MKVPLMLCVVFGNINNFVILMSEIIKDYEMNIGYTIFISFLL
jgi:hypothetical protein